MKKKVLLIDNDNVEGTLEIIEEAASLDGDLQYEVKCFESFNPVDKRFYSNGSEYSFESMRKELIEKILSKKIDVIGCDFNLLTEIKTLTYQIIEVIREHNKSATLFIYSGGMNRTTLQMFGDEGKGPAEKYLKIAITSNISAYITNRGAIPERVIEMIKNPSVLLQIEDFLTLNESLTLHHAHERFKGKQLFEIAKEVRVQSELGVDFTDFIIEKGLSNVVELNDF